MANKRHHKGAKAMDLSQFADALADGKVWAGVGRVTKFAGETSHFEIIPGDAENLADVMVDVAVFPNGEAVACRLGMSGGVWQIPAEGAQVAILVPMGDYEADPVIVGVLGYPRSADIATATGLSATTAVIVVPSGGQLLVHDGAAGDAVPLATKADVQALTDKVNAHADAFLTHTHATAALGPPVAPVVVPPAVAPSHAPDPAGTTVLKGK